MPRPNAGSSISASGALETYCERQSQVVSVSRGFCRSRWDCLLDQPERTVHVSKPISPANSSMGGPFDN